MRVQGPGQGLERCRALRTIYPEVLRVPGGGSTLGRDCVPIFYFFRRRSDTRPPKSFGDLLNHHPLEIGQILTREDVANDVRLVFLSASLRVVFVSILTC
jgi:hypothetical protein